MTTEPTQPQTEMGPAPAIGQGQSQGHRRRRRRRKNKSSQAGAAPMQPAQPQQMPSMPQPQGSQQKPPQQPRQGQGRRKKKFFQKGGGGPNGQPGNSISAPSNGRRKERQKGPRTFVGPMDHSYRAANGNVADAPPSTIPAASNGHGSFYPEIYPSGGAAPVREDAPTRIFCFIDDLFFQAKIQETARKLGIKVGFVKGDKDGVARIFEAPDDAKPTLVVFDLNNLNAKPLTLIPKFKTKFKKATSIIGFLNHLQGDLKMKATEAGCDTVMPRSAFSQSLPNLLRRYGMEEDDEYVPQPL
jgi:hypothetical protein